MNSNSGWIPVSQSPPEGVQLRLWVQLLNGGETEIHGTYSQDYGWDIPLGWKMTVLRILFWQPILTPYTPHSPATPIQKQPLPEMKAVLNFCRIFPTLTLYWNYSTEHRQVAWIERGTQIDKFEYSIPLEMLRKYLEPHHREAALWLWASYGRNPVPAIIEPDLQLQYLNLYQWGQVLISTYKDFRFRLETELLYNYCRLRDLKNQPVDLENDVALLLACKQTILDFGNEVITTLYREVASRTQDAYDADKAEWINQHGSQWLRYLFRIGISAEGEYVKERKQLEYPDFTLTQSLKTYPVPYCIPNELQERYATYIYNKGFMWYTDEDETLMLVKSNFLGRYTLWKQINYGSRPSSSKPTRHYLGANISPL